ncbi:MAG: hypothetical protein A4E45_01762 [Methanosaeta sp. PtaB.Bin039]|nr:MAG: hypothetical protein A4E45_01762 [Methanosaeta sp. PtaB.Bin039]
MTELDEAYRELQRIAKSYIQKSALEPVTKADLAKAITQATSTPAGARLARRIIRLERQQAVRKQYGMPEPTEQSSDDDWVDAENDGWPCYGSCQVRRKDL